MIRLDNNDSFNSAYESAVSTEDSLGDLLRNIFN